VRKTALRVPYRQLPGMLESMLSGYRSPSYPVPYRWMQDLDVEVGGGTATVRDPAKCLVMVADATGLKQHSRGEDLMARRWPSMVSEVNMRLALYNGWTEEATAAQDDSPARASRSGSEACPGGLRNRLENDHTVY